MTDSGIDGGVLVAIARESIHARLEARQGANRAEAWLLIMAATFVTLRRHGELRGCIGSIDARRPLGDDVAHNAQAAAFHDPRFAPLAREELDGLRVEVSLLSPRHPMDAATEADAIARLRPGVDGVYLEYDSACATFLPQVWESIPDPLVFLCELRRKAALPRRFWHPKMRLSRYTVEKFRDE
jgi:AmmeMemoRadiSam system protein A